MKPSKRQAFLLVSIAAFVAIWVVLGTLYFAPGREARPATAISSSPLEGVSAVTTAVDGEAHGSGDLSGSVIEVPDDRQISDLREFSLTNDTESSGVNWARQTEAVLDAAIRSVGSPVADVNTRCQLATCNVVVLYQPSFLLLFDGPSRDDATLAFLDDLDEALQPVIQSSLRLNQWAGAPFVQLSSVESAEFDLQLADGASRDDGGIIVGRFILSDQL